MEQTPPGGDGQYSSLDELQRQLNEDFAQTLGPMTSPQQHMATASAAGAASSGASATIATTISTVVLQGVPLQLVVAILKVGLCIHLC